MAKTGVLFTMAYRIVMCLGLANVVASSTSLFYSQPTNVTLNLEEGSTNNMVELLCTVRQLPATQEIVWYKNGIPISDDVQFRDSIANIVDTDRYYLRVLAVTNGGEGYGLGVGDITPSTASFDSGRYKCVVAEAGDTLVEESRVATVLVNNGAQHPDSDPICSLSDSFGKDIEITETPPTALEEGQSYKFKCLTDQEIPNVDLLSWSDNNGNKLQLDEPGVNIGGHLHISYTWTPSISDARNQPLLFTCTFQHPSLSTQRFCTMGPFDIQYSPIVTIDVDQNLEFVVNRNEVRKMNCTSDANPVVHETIWYYDNNEISDDDRFKIQGRALEISGFDEKENGEHEIRCKMTNVIGTSEAIANIHVMIAIPVMTSIPDFTSATNEFRVVPTKVTQKQDDTVIIASAAAGSGVFVIVIVVVIVTVVCVVKRRKARVPQTRNGQNIRDDVCDSDTQATVSSMNVVNMIVLERDQGTTLVSMETETKLQMKEIRNADENVNGQICIEDLYAKPIKKMKTSPGRNNANLDELEQDMTSDSARCNERLDPNKGREIETIPERASDAVLDLPDNEETDFTETMSRPQIKPKPIKLKKSVTVKQKQSENECGTVEPVRDITTTTSTNVAPFNPLYDEIRPATLTKDKPIDRSSTAQYKTETSEGVGSEKKESFTKNAEEVTYAELDLSDAQSRPGTRKDFTLKSDGIVYAELKM